jgi:hypothetical protein
LSNSNSSNHSQILSSSNRPGLTSSSVAPDRRHSAEHASPSPPIVVVSPDGGPSEPAHRAGHYGSPEGRSLGLDHSATPPRATNLNRLRSGPKDTIPIVGKPPRKQRSSRFVVTEKVEIERLPPFLGVSSIHRSTHLTLITFLVKKRRPTNAPNCSSRNFINAVSCSILTMQVQNSRGSRSKRRLCTRCWSTSPLNAVSSRRIYTLRLLTWSVVAVSGLLYHVP